MTKQVSARPASGEYAPYYERYISLVPDGEIISILTEQLQATQSLLEGINESKADHSYAPDKWSIKEVVGHMIDTERIFAYRALRIARNDQTPLSGFEQDDYVRHGGFRERALADLAEEFECVRRSTVHLLKSLKDEALNRRGLASDNEVSVRALAYIIAGHERHHSNVLREKYL
jgi:uncharacterized damage-inducible protein DinB